MLDSIAIPGAVLGVLLVLSLVLGIYSLRLKRRLHHFRRDLESLRAAATTPGRSEAEGTALNRLLIDLTRLTERLQTTRGVREIPAVAVDLVQRAFDAEGVLILFSRGNAEGNDGDRQLVVAATSSGGLERSRNEVIAFGEGELGLVAELQEAFDREDLASRRAARHATVPGLRSFRTDLAAPMVVGGRTFGVLALSGIGRRFDNEKTLLTLIAQTTGVGLHSAASYSELKSQVDLDGLTGILNRRALLERLQDLVEEAEQSGKSVGVFMFDVDDFRHYNDRNGHGAGDVLLQQMCALVSRSIRAEDVLGRIGGEEFLVVSPSQSVASTYGLAEKIRRAVEADAFEHGEAQPAGRVTVSGGIAVLPGHARDWTELLKQADRALYRAKKAGRNRIEIAVPEPSTAG